MDGFSFLISDDTSLYKSDKHCVVCKSDLGHGIIRSKKWHCYFCYRAICSGCSSQKVYQSKLKKEKRICDLCFQLGMEKKLNIEYSQELQQILENIAEVEQQTQFEQLTRTQSSDRCTIATENIAKLKAEHEERLAKLQDIAEDTRNKKQEIEAEAIAKREKYEELNSLVTAEEDLISQQREKVREMKEKLNLLKEKSRELKKEITDSQDEQSHILKTIESMRPKTNDSLFMAFLRVSQEYQSLIEESAHMDKQLQEKSFINMVHDSEDKQMQEQAKKNQRIIEHLRKKLEEKPADSLVNDPCKCFIF